MERPYNIFIQNEFSKNGKHASQIDRRIERLINCY
jgi:hypothetical protein